MSIRALFLFLALAGGVGSASALDDAGLAALVQQRLQGDRTDACFAVAVIGTTVSRAHVCADAGKTPRIDSMTAFEIGSVSKTMTSILLAEMIGQGKASLDDPLSAWLPEGTRVPRFEGKPILLRHVVTHTSGLPGLPPGVSMADPNDPYAALSGQMLLAALERSSLARAPGAQFEYSNFASMLLSWAVARRAGSDLETLFDQRLFQPLGMSHAYIGQRPDGVRIATGHTPNARPAPAWNFQTDLAGVGGVRATLDDMVRYVQAQLAPPATPLGAALRLGQQVVVADSRPAMAMNWMLTPLAGRRLHAHEGGTGGFSSFVAFDVENRQGVVILSDTALHSLGGLGSLGLHLLEPAIPLGRPRKAVTPPAELLDALVGQYQLEGAMKMQLSRKGDALVIQAEGQPAYAMGYDDAGDFYPLDFDALLRPQRRADGSHGFLWTQMGGVIAARRIDLASKPKLLTPTPAELQDYAGDYPLVPGFALKVFEREGQLFVQGSGQQPMQVAVVAKDVFVAEAVGAEIRFERAADGKVSGLVLLQGGQTLRGARQ